MTDDLMNKAKDQMNVLERVVVGVPGYKGYKEKELRRETDKTLRMVLTKQIEDQKAWLTALQVELISSGQLGLMDDMERCATKMQILADSIRTASYGYAPLFDDVRVKEEELDVLGAVRPGPRRRGRADQDRYRHHGHPGRPAGAGVDGVDPCPKQHCREPGHRVRPSPRGDPAGGTCGR